MPISGKPNAIVLPNAMRDGEFEDKDMGTSFVFVKVLIECPAYQDKQTLSVVPVCGR